ncbi:MAG: sodium:calcium antiporter [Epsilonproteobacteria bacterium]|nr:MAG: sodium:calcium antiporter [Campylobacterota bacterium]
MEILLALVLVVFTTWVIAKACDGFEVAADHLGRNMTDGVKGATINAIGSSMPELFVTFVFLFMYADTTGFAGGIGTTAGSAVFNTMVIPALSILVALKMFRLSSINVSKKVILRDGLMLIAAEFILIVTIGEKLEWWHGMMLMLLYVGYAGYMLFSMRKNTGEEANDNEDDEEEEDGDEIKSNRAVSFFKLDLEHAIIGKNKFTNGNSWLLLVISTLFIAIACYFLVEGAELFASQIGIASYFVAVIIVAAASSVPDTILSVKDAKKGNYDDAVSNALGSNIFDICFALGLPLFLYAVIYGPVYIPADIASDIVELRLLLLFLTIGAFLIFFFGHGMGKKKAYGLLAMYSFFTIFIIARAYEMPWVEPIANSLHVIQQYLS